MNELFSERLKAARKNAGYKANAFAVLCGISASYLSELESGKRSNPANLLVEKFANECSVTVDWLLGRDDSHGSNPCWRTPAPTWEKGPQKTEKAGNIEDSETHGSGDRKLEKGQSRESRAVYGNGAGYGPAVCRYPEGCDLEGEMAAVRERMTEVEETLAHMSSQLETVVGLLGSALGDGLNRGAHTREEKRKAG